MAAPIRRPARAAPRPAKAARWSTPPVLVRQVRNGVTESVHRGDIVEVDQSGRMIRALGDPDRLVMLRSTVKPFGVAALLEAGGERAFDLELAEIALMASSHSGEDLHVRTIQALYRRAGVSQTVLACGTEGMPLDALTAARLARDGEKPGPVRHMCSGQHSAIVLLAKLRGWDLETYWTADHPAQVLYREVVARAFGVAAATLRTAVDGCGLLTYAFPLRDVARAYAFLADPDAVPGDDPRASVAPFLKRVRDAMLAHPELVAGTARLCTDLMRAAEGRIIAKVGAEGVYCAALVEEGVGVALKVRDGSMHHAGVALLAVLREFDDAHGLRLRGVLEHPDVRRHGPGTIRNTRGEPTGEQRLHDVPRPFAPGLRAADPAAAGGGH